MSIRNKKRSSRSQELSRKAQRTTWFRLVTVATAMGVLALAGAGPSNAVDKLDGGPGDAVIDDFCSPTPTGQIVSGYIDSITMHTPGDTFSAATMVVAGTEVIVPRNLVVTLPANWQTMQQLFDNAPPACLAVGESGLAIGDSCLNGALGGFALILANRVSDFRLIAGDVDIAKNPDGLTGPVTHIDYTNGYFEINGIPGLPGSGQMIRPNDPDGINTIQQGPGCDPTMPNCSADVRYTNDPDNYTLTFSNGYPLCIPSTVTDGVNRLVGADPVTGVGDPFCPQTNRPADPFTQTVADSRFYAPMRIGDTVSADGNFEDIGGVHFLSAHTVSVNVALVTASGQPDYMIFDEVEWDIPGFSNARARTLLIGFTTNLDSQLDIFSLHKDPSDPNGDDQHVPLASTVGNPLSICQGVAGVPPCDLAAGGGIFKFLYDVDFIVGVTKAERSPCTTLFNAGFLASPVCDTGQELSIISPVSAEIRAVTKNSEALMALGVTNFNIRGDSHTYGQYLNPTGLGHPEFVEINLGLLDSPFIFAGLPWNLDRRLRVGGCPETGCESLVDFPLGTLGLDPFPWEEFDARSVSNSPTGIPGSQTRMFAHFPFGPGQEAPYPPLASTIPGDVVCDDGNPCTDGTCDSLTGCSFTPNDANTCTDGDVCTDVDTCVAGACVPGAVVPGCGCATLALASQSATIPATGSPFAVDVAIDSPAALGAYAVDYSWDPLALTLDSVGSAPEFSTICGAIDNVAGTVSCTAFSAAGVPAGVNTVATLNFTVVDSSVSPVAVVATVVEFVAQVGAAQIDACLPFASLSMATLCGDVTGDGNVNIGDALTVAQFQVGLLDCTGVSRFDLCDISPITTGPDGICGIGDALTMAQCTVGLIPCDFVCPSLVCPAP